MRLHRALEARLRTGAGLRDSDDGAAMMFVLLTMLIATSISLLLLGTIISQVGPVQFGQKNVRTVHAAEAGIDVALGQIRAATAADPLDATKLVGDRGGLPCVTGEEFGHLTGELGASPGDLSYDVEIRYYSEDPAGRNETWRADNALACAAGGGPTLTPTFALIQSRGLGEGVPQREETDGNRRLETIYDFQLTNANVAGGLIHTYYDGNAASRDLCFDAGSEAPAVNTRLTVQLCQPGQGRQLWSWRKDFTIALALTLDPSYTGTSLCVTAVGTGNDRQVQLRTCGNGFDQKWGYNDGAQFQGRLAGDTTSRHCLIVATDNTAGSFVNATTGSCGAGYNRRSTWRPEARVGAGSVGDIEGNFVNTPFQWVNFFEFGRCFDISNWNVNYQSMIAFPCKQDPVSAVGWNETLLWDDATKQLYTRTTSSNRSYQQAVDAGGAKYCVQSPASNGGFVLMKPCATGTIPNNQKWTVNRKVSDYSGSYTIVDTNNRCMSVGPPNTGAPDTSIHQWSSIIAETCDGSGRQKWNAPPNAAPSVTRDTRELPGS
ncbi:ricin-type beta-trefoil lectin domain protein [Jannaschia sp. R86511]|uniref:ricin-type beta-trefoil lectin domain protein n=1 Tax=Jannaschia sp. R86511 TaxID=3093853 RepID=UPI0036D2549A